MFRNVSDYENRPQFTIGGRVCPSISPEISAPDPATKATGIVATRLSCQLENGSSLTYVTTFPMTAMKRPWAVPELIHKSVSLFLRRKLSQGWRLLPFRISSDCQNAISLNVGKSSKRPSNDARE